jgi:hypothetical protein
VGGQFAVHASHHIVLLDRWKESYTVKIYRSKNQKNFEGYFKTFKLDSNFRLYPIMQDWKQGEIRWDRDQKTNDTKDTIDTKDTKTDGVKSGGPRVDKDKYKEKERIKEKEKPSAGISDQQSLMRGVL